MQRLFTLGYEGTSIGQFLTVLKARKVSTLVDVRALPLSRKKGFSKNQLAEECKQAGIGYEHWSEFGCPDSIRRAYKEDGDWSRYTRAFRKHLPAIEEHVLKLARRAEDESVCLVCFEADPMMCHRSFIAEASAKVSELEVVHLTSRGLAVSAS